ncbi:S-norcoclaurine synthase-like [Quillaja saponaria]|uniref:S-norcoclaurine synthase-like n=1 Tax=Quillaja saponaria TaxID=32244 RepID=A0AAD7L1I7_QUISA|nr:S-norcoclaurine synthase-like [Quillaja saponaria]
MAGQVSHELELNVPASQAWELYGTVALATLVEKGLPNLIQKIDLVEGDGGVGTVLQLRFAPGVPGKTDYKEKFTKIDNEKRIKEVEVVEGGYLDIGFTLYRTRIEVIEKENDSSVVKTTIEYELKEEAAANASLVSAETYAKIGEIAKNYLYKNKAS